MPAPSLTAAWRPVDTGDDTVAVAERAAIGTTARVAVWPPDDLPAALAATDDVLDALDHQASRFREDSEISWLHRRNGGLFLLSDGLAEALSVALAAARWTGGLVDPTVGEALISLGYDRDFATIDAYGREAAGPSAPVPGWRTVWLDGPMLRLPTGVRLDLGATAKALGSDRAVRAAMAATDGAGGVLVSLGGDLAVGGRPPCDGWPIQVADEPEPGASARTQSIRLVSGAVATSSTTCRRWRRADRVMHHIVDPRTGLPANGPWRTVTAGAATCADANAAATAAIVAGDLAEDWLARARVPARLVSHEGEVRHVGGWPDTDGDPIAVRSRSHVYDRASRP
ncbi:FAD:protein FMN transferase [Nocardioides panaciterrulae]|uniref:FAD:protein FMN transferase n=1 Tax=Nocardioides panaciterrulae TaxID=661492 RepID=A0A7Y9JBF7_9ACTN|nr:FAD:protein FMN transferase [Nocardioides panaciterrulae]NYD42742.1 thiamine biosynthesis lipoprotein [Nocardioides panaciterrulae]